MYVLPFIRKGLSPVEKLITEKILVFYNKSICLMPSMPGWIKKYKEISEAFGNSSLLH